MSQPFNRAARLKAPGRLDHSLSEFWVENPWEIVSHGHNLSGFERNRMLINVDGTTFVDASGVSGADSDGDGRAVAAADFRHNGRLDIILRQEGGGPLLLLENRMPTGNYLSVSLRGRASNRLGIGARLLAKVGEHTQVRELNPVNSHQSQMPCVVHFGLGTASQIDRLEIHWPAGSRQELMELAGNRHVIITEDLSGSDAIEIVEPGKAVAP